VIWSVLRRPMVIAIILGAVFAALNLPMPATLDKVFSMLAVSASSLALFFIGGALVGLPFRGNRGLAAFIALGKLVVFPAMAFALLLLAPTIGLPLLDRHMQVILILSAAMPMISIYAILCQDAGTEGLASLALLGTTAASFVTLSALLVWLL
jgi:hypothetical protein